MSAFLYNVSTITAIGRVFVAPPHSNRRLDLSQIYQDVALLDEDSAERARASGAAGFLTVRYGPDRRPPYPENPPPRKGAACLRSAFGNQVTVVVRVAAGAEMVNIKVFENGNVQLTGAKLVQHGRKAIQMLVDMLSQAFVEADVEADPDDALGVGGYRVCLINSDFRIGHIIRREQLHNLMMKQRPRGACSFEPCIYPGVKISFMWNGGRDTESDVDDGCEEELTERAEEQTAANDGVCRCDPAAHCRGRGRGEGTDGRCRKVTIVVFQSGCVIVTGAQSHRQVRDARRFVFEVVTSNLLAVSRGVEGGGKKTP